MQLVKVFVSVMLAAAVSAKGHDKNNGTVSTARQCRSIARMTKLVDLAANETLLEEKTGGNQTRIDAIKAEAANITTSLTVLTSNSTLIGECAVVAAYDEAVRACWEVRELEGIMALAANDTELQSVFDGNTTQIDALKAMASTATTKLADLQGNATQATFCAAQADVSTCKHISKLQETIALAGNDTALQAKFDGNATKIDRFKTQATKAKTRLDKLMSNATLMRTCSGLTQAGATTSDAVASNKGSATARLQSLGGMATAPFVVLLGCAMLLL